MQWRGQASSKVMGSFFVYGTPAVLGFLAMALQRCLLYRTLEKKLALDRQSATSWNNWSNPLLWARSMKTPKIAIVSELALAEQGLPGPASLRILEDTMGLEALNEDHVVAVSICAVLVAYS